MTGGIIFAVMSGMTWTAIGIVISCCARGKFDITAYGLMQSCLSGAAAILLYSDFSAFAGGWQSLMLPALILSAGMINALAQYLVRRSMQGGNHAPVWAMMQSAMLMPFLAGIIFFGEKADGIRCLAVGLLVAGVFIPCAGGFGKVRQWLLPAWAAFLLYGILQSMYMLPSHLPVLHDTASLRPALVCFGNMSGWLIIAGFERRRPGFSGRALIAALIMMIIHAAGAKWFFTSLDELARHHASGIAIPLMQGANLCGFGLYSLIFLKEKNSVYDVLSFGVILCGFILLTAA